MLILFDYNQLRKRKCLATHETIMWSHSSVKNLALFKKEWINPTYRTLNPTILLMILTLVVWTGTYKSTYFWKQFVHYLKQGLKFRTWPSVPLGYDTSYFKKANLSKYLSSITILISRKQDCPSGKKPFAKTATRWLSKCVTPCVHDRKVSKNTDQRIFHLPGIQLSAV